MPGIATQLQQTKGSGASRAFFLLSQDSKTTGKTNFLWKPDTFENRHVTEKELEEKALYRRNRKAKVLIN